MKTMITAVMLLISTMVMSQTYEVPFDRMVEWNTWTDEKAFYPDQGGRIKVVLEENELIWIYRTNGLPSLYYIVSIGTIEGGAEYHLLDKNRQNRSVMYIIDGRAAHAEGDWITIYNYNEEW